MDTLINKKEIEGIFEEFTGENEIKAGRKKNLEGFLDFLKIDFYDWVKENLRCYFREEN